MRFNIGDIAFIKKDLTVNVRQDPAIVPDMARFFGTSFRVIERFVRPNGQVQYRGRNGYWWREDWLTDGDFLDNTLAGVKNV